LGSARTVSLREARERAKGVRSKIFEGMDPIADRKAARGRAKLEAAKAMTFKECADKYIEANRPSWKNETHAAQWFASFNETKRGTLKFPAATEAINDLPIAAIDTALILKVLEPLWTKTPESASRIRGRIEAVLDWAKVRGYREGENPARWRDHLKQALPARSKLSRGHHDAVAYADMPDFMAELRGKDGLSARALEFTILTAARTSEIIGAKWSEFDLDARMWTIPAERMKAAKEHRIPLSDRALEVLSAPREGDYVFPGARAGKPLSNWAMLELVRGMRGMGATVHGFRSSFKDWASDQTSYPNELSEVALAHAVREKTEAAYRRGDQMEKRRRLMADWATYCEKGAPAEGDNVRRIRARA
jgi:integrase